MTVTMKQGVNESLTFEMPFDVSLLTKFTVDLWQHGSQIITKTNDVCVVDGNTITATLTQHDTMKLSPQRVSLNFRGLYADGGTVIVEDVPVVISRSQYRKVMT